MFLEQKCTASRYFNEDSRSAAIKNVIRKFCQSGNIFFSGEKKKKNENGAGCDLLLRRGFLINVLQGQSQQKVLIKDLVWIVIMLG